MLRQPRQLFTSYHLLGVNVRARCRHYVLQLGEPWDKVPELVFDIFTLLGRVRQRDRSPIQWGRTS